MPQTASVKQSAPAELITGCNLGYNGYTDPTQTKPQSWAAARNVFSGAFGNVQRCRFANVVTPSQAGVLSSLKYFALPTAGAYLMADVAGKLFSYNTAASYSETQRFNPYIDPLGAGNSLLNGPWSRESLQNILYEMNGQVKQAGRLANAATIEGFGLDAPDASPQVLLFAGASQVINTISRQAGIVTAQVVANLTIPGGNGIGMVNVKGVTDPTFNGTFLVTSGSGTMTLVWSQAGLDTTSSSGTADVNITKSVGRSYSWAWENANKPHVGAPSPATQYVAYTAQNGTIQLIEPGIAETTSGSPNVIGANTQFSAAWIGRSLLLMPNDGATPVSHSRIIAVADATHLTVADNVPFSSASLNSGPNAPTNAANVGLGTTAWSNPTNIEVEDGNFAVRAVASGGTGQRLAGSSFAFNIPLNSAIVGLKLEVKGFSTTAPNCIVGLGKGIIGTKTKSVAYPATNNFMSFGGPTDLWQDQSGNPFVWLPKDINDPSFTAFIAESTNSSGGTITESIDFVRVTVYYTRGALFQVYDSQSTHVRFYETADGGATYLRTQRNAFNPNSSGSGPVDVGLQFFDDANSEPPFFPFTTEVAQLFNLPPPIGRFLAQYQGRLVVFGVIGAGQSFFYSNSENTSVGMPQESYSPLNQATLPMQNAQLFGYLEFPGSAIFWSDKQDMFRMTGLLTDQTATGQTAPQQGATITRLPYGLGCATPFACAMTPLGGIWLSSNGEIWLFTDRYAPRNIGRPVQDILDSILPANRSLARMKYYHTGTRNWLALAVPENLADHNTTLLILDLDLLASNGSPSYFTFDMATNHPSWYVYNAESESLEVVQEAGGIVRLLAGQTSNVRDVDFKQGFGTEIPVTSGQVALHAWGNDTPFIIKRPSWVRFNTNDAPKMLAKDGWSFQVLGIDDDVYTFEHPLELDLTPGVNDSSTLCGNPNLVQGESFRHSPELFRIGGVNFVAGRRLKFVVNFPSLIGVDFKFRSVQLGFGPTPPR